MKPVRAVSPFPSQLQLASLALCALALSATQAQAAGVSTRHAREEVRSARLLGRLPATRELGLDLVLPVRDPAGLAAFVAEVSNPRGFSYRRYMTPAEFTEAFGPTQADYDAVIKFARESGLRVTGGSRDGMEVQVKGTVSAVESALHVRMQTYQHPTEAREFYAPDREPTTGLPFALWHISGLDNYSIPHPMVVKKSDSASGVRPMATHATTGSGPSASFLGSDMRAAYYGSGPLTGAGQTVGLLEYYGTDLADLNTYYANIGQTNQVPITLLSVDGTSTACVSKVNRRGEETGCDDTEQTLDMTQALGMAPGLAALTMYIGSTDTAIISAMTAPPAGVPLPGTIGCSWGWTPADPSTLDPYFQKMAAQGQTFFAASGDSSTWSRRNEAWPADDAYVISVGGTDLVTAGAAGAWASETAWADSGGGISPDDIAIPAWQKLAGVINSKNKGSTKYRNGPDVAANANFTFYTCADQTACLANEYGGTSFATPMWAAFIALANQQAAENGLAPLGFFNPTIYANAGEDLHDITSGTSGSYSAVAGYDLVTGWGSPTAALIPLLVP